MADIYWVGDAPAVAQVHTGSIDTVDATPSDNTFTVTIGGIAISEPGDTDVATTATNLRASLNASTHPYFSTITWSGTSGDIIGTADTAGVPFTAALTVTGGGTGTVTDFAVTTASAGPNDWSTALNWSGGAVPVNADNVTFRDNAVNVAWGLDQSAVELGNVIIEQTYTGRIGLDRTNFATSANGETVSSTVAAEYREDYLIVGYDNLDIGQNFGPGSPAGSRRLKIDNDQTTGTPRCTVHNTASSSVDSGLPGIRLKFNNASTELFIRAAPGGVGVAIDEPNETSTLSKVSIPDFATNSAVHISDGVTITTFEQFGGFHVLQAAGTVTTLNVNGGTLTTEGAYKFTTANMNGGTWNANNLDGSDVIADTVNLNGGTLDTLNSSRARTITTLNVEQGGTIRADNSILTITTLTDPDGPYTATFSEI